MDLWLVGVPWKDECMMVSVIETLLLLYLYIERKYSLCYVLFIISLCTYVYKGRSIKYSLCKHLYPSIHFNDNC